MDIEKMLDVLDEKLDRIATALEAISATVMGISSKMPDNTTFTQQLQKELLGKIMGGLLK